MGGGGTCIEAAVREAGRVVGWGGCRGPGEQRGRWVCVARGQGQRKGKGHGGPAGGLQRGP